MSNRLTLEEQKRILLEKLALTRDFERLELAQVGKDNGGAQARLVAGNEGVRGKEFPRSYLFKILLSHPYSMPILLAAVLLIGPKKIVRTVQNSVGAFSSTYAMAKHRIPQIARTTATVINLYKAMQGRNSERASSVRH